MSVLDIINNREEGCVLCNLDQAESANEERKAKFGILIPAVCMSVSNVGELFEFLQNEKIQLFFQSPVYYNENKKYLNEDTQVFDFTGSLDLSDPTFKEERITSMVADNYESFLILTEKTNRSIKSRMAHPLEPYDFGCSMEDLRKICQSTSQTELSILIYCNEQSAYDPEELRKEQPNLKPKYSIAQKVSATIQYLEKTVQVVREYGITISSFFILGDAIYKLAYLEDSESKTVLANLLEFGKKYSVTFDASRLYSEKVFTILTPIIGGKEKVKKREKSNIYYVDDGIYTSLYGKRIYDETIEPIPISVHGQDFTNAELHKSIIFGPTCDSVDCLGEEFYLPRMEIRDWMMFKNCGYRCRGYFTGFNGFKEPEVIIVRGELTLYTCFLNISAHKNI